jgi:hypothetical protein
MSKPLSKRLMLFSLATAILGLAFGAGILTGVMSARPDVPNLDHTREWLLIKVFQGALDKEGKNVDADVSAIFRLSDGKYPHTVMQNKIEIRTDEGSFRFLWPDNGTFVAGWCDILDVDADRDKEFLLYAGTGSLRIVSFAHGKFQFRPHLDELLSLEHSVGPFDLDGDGRLEFVEDEHFPSDLDTSAKWVQIPRVKRWSRTGGFIDVSKEYPRYYREQVIPGLERRLSTEQDPELQQTISHAVEFLRRERL